MRTRQTNILQGVVLFTGIFYLVVGVFLFFSPYRAFRLAALHGESSPTADLNDSGGITRTAEGSSEITEDDWLKQTVNDEIIYPLYYAFRILALLLAVSGLSLVMPLFDPLRYRGLIYYQCLIFPSAAALSAFVFLRVHHAIVEELWAGRGGSVSIPSQPVMLIIAVAFTVIAVLAAGALILTRKQAHEGKE